MYIKKGGNSCKETLGSMFFKGPYWKHIILLITLQKGIFPVFARSIIDENGKKRFSRNPNRKYQRLENRQNNLYYPIICEY